MILTLDIGNTNIKSAVFDGNNMVKYWRLKTDGAATSDELGIHMLALLQNGGLTPECIDGIIMSSVVPTINFTVDHMCRDYLGRAPIQIGPGMKTGLNIRYENPRELGGDRIANAVACYAFYGGPSIFIDFGTATTFGVLSGKGDFLGGAICPGIKISTEALVSGAAKLPRVELVRPETVIGRNTVTNMQSGIYYGYIGLVENIVRKMKEELGREDVKVVATGGLSRLLAPDTHAIDVFDGLLTLKGLRLIYERNL